jgi:hypothetical protein
VVIGAVLDREYYDLIYANAIEMGKSNLMPELPLN